MRIETDTLILVADGRKILLLRNTGTAVTPQLTVEYGEEQKNPPDRDQKTDAQGQRPRAVGSGQPSTAETDYHQQAEDRFAIHAAELLHERAQDRDYEKLIVVAAPATLGVLRQHYHAEVKARLVTEVAKDMTGTPIDQITARLLALETAES